MQDQNIQLMQQLREKDDANLKLMSEVRDYMFFYKHNVYKHIQAQVS